MRGLLRGMARTAVRSGPGRQARESGETTRLMEELCVRIPVLEEEGPLMRVKGVEDARPTVRRSGETALLMEEQGVRDPEPAKEGMWSPMI